MKESFYHHGAFQGVVRECLHEEGKACAEGGEVPGVREKKDPQEADSDEFDEDW